MRFSLAEFLSDVSADATAISLDRSGGGYDRLHDLLERHNTLPHGKVGRATLIAVMLIASRLVKQQLGAMGPVANFVNEVAEDGVREEAKRILETINETVNSSVEHDALWEIDETVRAQLLEQFRQLDPSGQQRLREQMMRATVIELVVLAGMSREDLETILSILTPETVKQPGVTDRIATSFFPWLKD